MEISDEEFPVFLDEGENQAKNQTMLEVLE